jgi:hypothetical protein
MATQLEAFFFLNSFFLIVALKYHLNGNPFFLLTRLLAHQITKKKAIAGRYKSHRKNPK